MPLVEHIKRWQDYVRGWWNYFSICQQRQGRLNALRRLKAKPYHLKQASGSVGIWRLARSPMLQTVLDNARLRQWGLFVPSDFATI
jgi:RNA-directed DNA polymerase